MTCVTMRAESSTLELVGNIRGVAIATAIREIVDLWFKLLFEPQIGER